MTACMFFFVSCRKDEHPEETLNDNIPGTFFDVSFGANKDDLIRHFGEHGFHIIENQSTGKLLHFSPRNGSYSYEGMRWGHLMAEMSEDSFCSIEFYRVFKDKAEAISYGNSLLNAVSGKYRLAEAERKNKSIYILYGGESKNEPGRKMVVFVERYESFDKSILYRTGLAYCDGTYMASVRDNYK